MSSRSGTYYQAFVEIWWRLYSDRAFFNRLAASLQEPAHAEVVARLKSKIDGDEPFLHESNQSLAALEALDQGLFALHGHLAGARTLPPRIEVKDKVFRVRTRMVVRERTSHHRQTGHLHSCLNYHRILPESVKGYQISVVPLDGQLARQLRDRSNSEQALRVYVGGFEDGVELRSEPHGQDGCYFVGLTDMDTRWQSARRALEEARDQGADIVVFPELTLCPQLRGQVRTWLTDNNAPFLFILPGSFHEPPQPGDQRAGGDETALPVHSAELLDGRGRILLRHCKLLPGGPERLCAGHQVNLLETPIGVIATPICRDFCEEDPGFGELWEVLSPDWALTPSMADANGMSAHKKQAEKRGRAGPCVVVVANQPHGDKWPSSSLRHGFITSFYEGDDLQEVTPQRRLIEVRRPVPL